MRQPNNFSATDTSFGVTTNFNNIEDPNEDLTCVFEGDDLLSDISWTGPNNSVISAAKVLSTIL